MEPIQGQFSRRNNQLSTIPALFLHIIYSLDPMSFVERCVIYILEEMFIQHN